MKITCGNITKDIEKGATVMQCLRALDADMSGVLINTQRANGIHSEDIIDKWSVRISSLFYHIICYL